MTASVVPRRRLLYGRSRGARLKHNDRARLAELLPKVALALPPEGATLPRSDLLVPGTTALWLEIGFGGGEHLASQALARPDVTHLGVEPYLNGVASLLRRVEADGLTNVRILVDDARLLLDGLAPASLERIAVLFPDPWPKLRHHKRRIVNAVTVAAFADLLKPGGELRLATDDDAYASSMLQLLRGEPRLRWTANRARDWRTRPADWPATRYEAKALEAGREPVFLRFAKIGGRATTARSPLSGSTTTAL